MARSPAAEIMRREWNEGVRGMLVFQAMSWGMPGGAGGMGGERVNPPMVNTRQHPGEHTAAPWRGGGGCSHPPSDKEAPEEEVGVGPRGGLRHDGSLRQEADAGGTRSARSDQQGHVCRHGPTATGGSL